MSLIIGDWSLCAQPGLGCNEVLLLRYSRPTSLLFWVLFCRYVPNVFLWQNKITICRRVLVLSNNSNEPFNYKIEFIIIRYLLTLVQHSLTFNQQVSIPRFQSHQSCRPNTVSVRFVGGGWGFNPPLVEDDPHTGDWKFVSGGSRKVNNNTEGAFRKPTSIKYVRDMC